MSLAIGLIVLLFFPYTAQWLYSTVSSYKPPFLPITDGAGNEVPYVQSNFFLAHLSIFSFAIALILDGLILWLWPKPAGVMTTFAITVIAVLLNVWYVVASMGRGEGPPLTSAVAVAIGGYMAAYQWRLVATSPGVRR